MAKALFYIAVTLILIVFAGFFLLGKNVGSEIENSGEIPSENGNFQKVTLSIKNYNYYPNTVAVKAGQPVRIYLDNSVVGCYRSFTIKDFGIAKYLKTPSDYVEFTPTKPGTHRFACSMGMGTGTLIVE